MIPRFTVTAHRGAKGLVQHENTLEAFEKAVEIGAHAIEFDVRKSCDNVLFIHHDDAIDGIKLSTLTIDKIQDLSQSKGYHAPTLKEVLIAMKNRMFMDIELKEMGYEDQFVAEILSVLEPHMFQIRSFDDFSVKIIKKHFPNLIVGLLLGVEHPKHGIFTRFGELFPLWRILATHCDFVSPHYRLVKFGYAARMHALKKHVYVWTVNEEALMRKMMKCKVDGIVTDHPDLGLSILKNR